MQTSLRSWQKFGIPHKWHKRIFCLTGGDSDAGLVPSSVRAKEEGDRIGETAHRAECH